MENVRPNLGHQNMLASLFQRSPLEEPRPHSAGPKLGGVETGGTETTVKQEAPPESFIDQVLFLEGSSLDDCRIYRLCTLIF